LADSIAIEPKGVGAKPAGSLTLVGVLEVLIIGPEWRDPTFEELGDGSDVRYVNVSAPFPAT